MASDFSIHSALNMIKILSKTVLHLFKNVFYFSLININRIKIHLINSK